MNQDVDKEQELALLRAVARMNAKVLGLVLGLLFGIVIFVATNWLVLKGEQPDRNGHLVLGPHLALLGQFFIGYKVTLLGSLIGFAYAFVVGAATGWLIALIYNRVAGMRG